MEPNISQVLGFRAWAALGVYYLTYHTTPGLSPSKSGQEPADNAPAFRSSQIAREGMPCTPREAWRNLVPAVCSSSPRGPPGCGLSSSPLPSPAHHSLNCTSGGHLTYWSVPTSVSQALVSGALSNCQLLHRMGRVGQTPRSTRQKQKLFSFSLTKKFIATSKTSGTAGSRPSTSDINFVWFSIGKLCSALYGFHSRQPVFIHRQKWPPAAPGITHSKKMTAASTQ